MEAENEDEGGSPAVQTSPVCCRRAIPAGRRKREGWGRGEMDTPGLRRALSGAGEGC